MAGLATVFYDREAANESRENLEFQEPLICLFLKIIRSILL
jgi:hypothetical protein